MQRTTLRRNHMLAVVFIGLLAGGPVLAEKPAHAGGGKDKDRGQGEQQHNQQDDRQMNHDGNGNRDNYSSGGISVHFDDRQRTAVRNYYSEQIRSGHCPPGLAKKNNGCLPPGQAKKWTLHRPLPRDVIYYDLSPEIIVHLGVPPPAYKYVRVANDILLLAVGTGMVIDAIEDLSRL